MILAIIAVVALIMFALAAYQAFYQAPTCSDGVQNQSEQGIDCGGPCPYLCTALEEPPVVRFTQEFASAPRLTDVIAYIDNPNQTAYARNVSYQVALYGADRTLVAPTIAGTIDLPPGATVPVFIPNINTGNAPVAVAFLTINADAIKWQAGRDTRIVPTVVNQTVGGTTGNPRIIATLANPSTSPLSNVRVIVAVFNVAGNVIAASQTVLPSIIGQGSATATFTWNAAFPGAVTRVDVLPIIPLSDGSQSSP